MPESPLVPTLRANLGKRVMIMMPGAPPVDVLVLEETPSGAWVLELQIAGPQGVNKTAMTFDPTFIGGISTKDDELIQAPTAPPLIQ